eukprot:1169549_1
MTPRTTTTLTCDCSTYLTKHSFKCPQTASTFFPCSTSWSASTSWASSPSSAAPGAQPGISSFSMATPSTPFVCSPVSLMPSFSTTTTITPHISPSSTSSFSTATTTPSTPFA